MGKFELRSGARLAAAAGLGLTLALGAAPVVAMATEGDAQVVTEGASITIDGSEEGAYETLSEAVAAANAGQTIVLPAGEFDGGVVINKAVNLKGAGAGLTVINGAVSFNASDAADRISVSGITFRATPDAYNMGLGLTNTDNDGYTLSVNGCAFEGWQFAIGVNSNAKGCTLDVTSTTCSDVFCVAGIKNGTNVRNLDFGDSGYQYAVQDFVSGNVGNYYYETPQQYTEDKADDTLNNPSWDASSDPTVPTDWEAYTADANGKRSYGSLKGLVEAAKSDITITLNDDVVITEDKGIEVPQGVDVTVEGNGKTITFSALSAFGGAKGIASGTELTVNNVNFVSDKGRYAVLVAKNSPNSVVNLKACSFTGLKCAVLVDTQTDLGDDGAFPQLSITEAKFTDTDFAYSIDTVSNGAIHPTSSPTVSWVDNEPDEGIGETWENAGFAVTSNGVTRNYTTIDGALAAAKNGDTITLAPGEHQLDADQCFVLNKRVTIQGAADGSTVITGSGVADYGNGLFTFSSGSEGSVLKDLTINYSATGAQRAAVYFDYGFAEGSDDEVTKIQNVHFKGSDDLTNERAIAISSTYTTGGFVEVSGCTIENFAYGMYFNGIHDLAITDNTINGTKYNAINIAGDGSVPCENIVIEGNTLMNISAANYGDDAYSSGINVGSNSSSVTIEDNSISMLNGKKPVNIVQDDDTNDTVVVTYKVDGVDYATVIAGIESGEASFAAPADPSKSGYTFRGWDYAGANVSVKDGIVAIALPESGAPDKGYTFSAQFSKNSVPSTPSGDAVKVEQSEGGKVSVTPTRADEGDEVTITATPDEGQEVREVKVVDEDGNEVQVKAGEKDGEYVFTMPDGAVTVTVTFGCDGGELCPTHSFTDVDQSAWYHDAVDWAVAEGVLNGYGEGGESLGPVADVTRAEMAQMLWNQAGRPEAEADLSAFTDVASDGWYAPALAWCVSEGIFSGYGDTFGTERTISREEAATVLWRLSGSPEADADLSGYDDASSVSEYATGAIEWAVANGVLTGKGDVALDPQAGCTRGEVAAMMMRMAE